MKVKLRNGQEVEFVDHEVGELLIIGRMVKKLNDESEIQHGWVCRESEQDRGMRLHQTTRGGHGDIFETAEEALADYFRVNLDEYR